MTTPSVNHRLRALEWVICMFDVGSVTIRGIDVDISRCGWFAFLAANFASGGFVRGIRTDGLSVRQAGFTAAPLLGLIRALPLH